MLDAVLSFSCDLDRGIDRTLIRPALLTGDRHAHSFRITVLRSGEDASLTGAIVSAYFVRADGVTVPITGSMEGSVAVVTLPDGCYRVPGRFQMVVKLSTDSGISTVFWGDGAVASSSTDVILDDEDVIPSLDDLLAQIAATEAAASNANNAAYSANTASASASTAAERANAAASSIESIGAEATTLSPGSAATAAWSMVDGAKVLLIGVPQGLQGPQGEKGEPGKDGSGSVSSVNGVASVGGNVTLTASDVGALPEDGTAANAALLGGKAPGYYLRPWNRLDDSDFSRPVNQRGQSSYTTAGAYCIDRWFLQDGSTLTVNSGSITVTGTMVQRTLNAVQGGTYTLAVGKADGSVQILSTHGWNSDEGCYAVQLPAGTYLWAALYEGEYTADTLPPYLPRGFAAELLECMRYYRTLNVLFGTEIGSVARQLINYTPAMRISPTASAAVSTGSSSTASAAINVATDRYIDISTNSWGNALVTLSADL